ncbi:MAG: DUF3710 domain-containing protein [Propionibacteriaceae bacterium]|jgi:hypothetical protein|nr:DUF3710 domain-containing protein [Propionibacteriaceae bacterium]
MSPTSADSASSPGSPASPASADEPNQSDRWADLDLSRDWRDDGPFDITEVELDDDPVERIDLGPLIVTSQPDMRIQLAVNPRTQTADAMTVSKAGAGLVIKVLAAPSQPGYVAERRQQIVDETTKLGGQVLKLSQGPFGTQIDRRLPQAEGPAVRLRDWQVQGSRWLLEGTLLGPAATDDAAAAGLRAEFEEFFRNLIVRRGDTALVPGSVLGLKPSAAS